MSEGQTRRLLPPTFMSCNPSVQHLMTPFSGKVAGSPRLMELSNTVPSVSVDAPTRAAGGRPRAWGVSSSSVVGCAPAAVGATATTTTARTASRDLLHIADLLSRATRGGRPGARPRGGSVLVLERDLHLGAIGAHLAVLDLQVELGNLGDAQVAQRLRRLVDRGRGGLLPRVGARPDQLDHPVDALRHGSSFSTAGRLAL